MDNLRSTMSTVFTLHRADIFSKPQKETVDIQCIYNLNSVPNEHTKSYHFEMFHTTMYSIFISIKVSFAKESRSVGCKPAFPTF